MLYLSKPVINPEWKLYRVRSIENNWDVSSVCEHSYPPSSLCKKNRANLPGHPVLYCSGNPSIALLETIRNNQLDTNKTYCLSMWTVKQRLKPFIVSPFIYNVKNENYQDASNKILSDKLKQSLKNSSHSKDWKSFKTIIEYLSTSFVEDDEKNYSISSFIGHSHLYMPHDLRTDFFIYPSIQSSMKGVNIAINPETADKHLTMKYLLILKVTELDIQNNHIQISVSHFGSVVGNRILIKSSGSHSMGPDPDYLKIFKEFTPTL